MYIHSIPDELISINDSRQLYIELKKLGFKYVYLIEAKEGGHAQACFYDADYGMGYGIARPEIMKRLCAIYAKHELPLFPDLNKLNPKIQQYKPALEAFCKPDVVNTQECQKLLAEMQPTIAQVEKRINPGSSCCSSSCRFSSSSRIS